MDNHSLPELAEELAQRLTAIGLHIDGQASIHGAVQVDEEQNEDSDIDSLDDEGFIGLDDLTDRLKGGEAFAVIHMNFSVNKLAWTDRILHPDTYLDPETVGEMGVTASMKEQIKERLSNGESFSDIAAELFGKGGTPDEA